MILSASNDISANLAVKNWQGYAVEWTSNTLKWWLNGNLVATETNPSAISQKAQYIIFNHALKAASDGSQHPENSVVEVDYIRVWKPISA